MMRPCMTCNFKATCIMQEECMENGGICPLDLSIKNLYNEKEGDENDINTKN